LNSQQLYALLDLAENAKNSKDWKTISKFIETVSPDLVAELCQDLLSVRSGFNKTPSIIPSKNAMDRIFQMGDSDPNKNKLANGFSLSYPLKSEDKNLHLNENHKRRIQIIDQATKNNTMADLKERLEDLAKIYSWDLKVEIGSRKDYPYSISFVYTRQRDKDQLEIL